MPSFFFPLFHFSYQFLYSSTKKRRHAITRSSSHLHPVAEWVVITWHHSTSKAIKKRNQFAAAPSSVERVPSRLHPWYERAYFIDRYKRNFGAAKVSNSQCCLNLVAPYQITRGGKERDLLSFSQVPYITVPSARSRTKSKRNRAKSNLRHWPIKKFKKKT